MIHLSKLLSKPAAAIILLSFAILPISQVLAVFPDEPETVEDVEGGMPPEEGEARELSYMETLQAFKYGKAFIASRLYGPAILQLEQALEVLPDDADANYYMGLAHLGLEDPTTAVPFLSQALTSDDDYYGAYEQLGLVYLQLGQTADAQALSDRLIEKMTACVETCPDALSTASASLQAAIDGNQTSAIDSASLLLGKAVEISVVYRGAIAEINQGNYNAAIDLLKKTKSEAGPHPDVLTYMGFAYRKLEKYDQAIAYYRQALAFDDEHKAANEYLGELYVEMGDLSRASLQLAKLDVLCPFSCAEKEELQRWISLAE